MIKSYQRYWIYTDEQEEYKYFNEIICVFLQVHESFVEYF